MFEYFKSYIFPLFKYLLSFLAFYAEPEVEQNAEMQEDQKLIHTTPIVFERVY